eukprot:13459_1
MDERRVVFVSLHGFFKTWMKCPSDVLHSAVVIVPLKRKWIYHRKLYSMQIQSNIVTVLSGYDNDEIDAFIKLLKWKDSQHLVFWAMDSYDDEYKQDNDNESVSGFWFHFSSKIRKLNDPITGNKYSAINTDELWW